MKFPLIVIGPIFKLVMKIVSTVVFLLTIFSAFGGKANPEYLTVPAVFCLALPYFAILTGILIIFWALMRKIIFTALGVVTLIICASPLSVAFPLHGRQSPDDENNRTFKIISWNVLHTDDIRKPEYGGNRAVEYMINSGADVICLAELLNFTPSELKKASPQLIDSLIRVYPFRAGTSRTDIKVISKYPVTQIGLTDKKGGEQPRFDFFKVNFPGGRFLNIGMVHLYSYDLSEEERKVVSEMKTVGGAKESVKELKGSILSKLRNAFRRRAENAAELREAINTFRPSSPLIICGDFNDVPASWAYNLVKGEDMKDAYAETNFGPAITYNLHGFYFHIDQMLYRGDLKALKLKVGNINTSDHYPLIGEFEFTAPDKK